MAERQGFEPWIGGTYTHFPGVRLQPLGHLSANRIEASFKARPQVVNLTENNEKTSPIWPDRPMYFNQVFLTKFAAQMAFGHRSGEYP